MDLDDRFMYIYKPPAPARPIDLDKLVYIDIPPDPWELFVQKHGDHLDEIALEVMHARFHAPSNTAFKKQMRALKKDLPKNKHELSIIDPVPPAQDLSE